MPLHNPGDYPPMMGTSQEQALGTKKFWQNQALFRRYNAVDGYLKKKIVMVVQPVFLYPLVEKLIGFVQVSTLAILQYLFTSYGAIDEIDLEEKAVKTMEPYDPAEPIVLLTNKLEKGREYVHAGGKKIYDAVMMYKGITLLEQAYIFNNNIREWRRQTTNLKTWDTFKTF